MRNLDSAKGLLGFTLCIVELVPSPTVLFNNQAIVCAPALLV